MQFSWQQIQQNFTDIQNWMNSVNLLLRKPHQFTEVTDTQSEDIIMVSRNETVHKIKVSNLNASGSFTRVIYLGVVTTPIQDYINTNDSTDWDLDINSNYYFEYLNNGVIHKYLYVGEKPKYLGASQSPNAIGSEFVFQGVRDLFIDGSRVQKGSGNTDLENLESGDAVIFKTISNSGDELVIPYGIYNGGTDRQLEGSYDLKSILI